MIDDLGCRIILRTVNSNNTAYTMAPASGGPPPRHSSRPRQQTQHYFPHHIPVISVSVVSSLAGAGGNGPPLRVPPLQPAANDADTVPTNAAAVQANPPADSVCAADDAASADAASTVTCAARGKGSVAHFAAAATTSISQVPGNAAAASAATATTAAPVEEEDADPGAGAVPSARDLSVLEPASIMAQAACDSGEPPPPRTITRQAPRRPQNFSGITLRHHLRQAPLQSPSLVPPRPRAAAGTSRPLSPPSSNRPGIPPLPTQRPSRARRKRTAPQSRPSAIGSAGRWGGSALRSLACAGHSSTSSTDRSTGGGADALWPSTRTMMARQAAGPACAPRPSRRPCRPVSSCRRSTSTPPPPPSRRRQASRSTTAAPPRGYRRTLAIPVPE